MMGEPVGRQDRLFYEFDLEDMVPGDHLLRRIGKRVVPLPLRRPEPGIASIPRLHLHLTLGWIRFLGRNGSRVRGTVLVRDHSI